MEDGIERMMTSELYNIHFLNENKYKNEKIKKNIVKELTVKELTVKQPISITNVKESISTNPQSQV